MQRTTFAAPPRLAVVVSRFNPEVTGGLLSGAIETHIIPPGIPGFQQAGGYAGPSGSQYDFNHYPHGNLTLAESYMKKAGYSSGKCSDTQGPGHCTLTMVVRSNVAIGKPPESAEKCFCRRTTSAYTAMPITMEGMPLSTSAVKRMRLPKRPRPNSAR